MVIMEWRTILLSDDYRLQEIYYQNKFNNITLIQVSNKKLLIFRKVKQTFGYLIMFLLSHILKFYLFQKPTKKLKLKELRILHTKWIGKYKVFFIQFCTSFQEVIKRFRFLMSNYFEQNHQQPTNPVEVQNAVFYNLS